MEVDKETGNSFFTQERKTGRLSREGRGGTEGNVCSDMGTVVTAFLEEQDDTGIHSLGHTQFCGLGNGVGDRKPHRRPPHCKK